MSIVTISRGSYSRGKEVAEKLADRLGYPCISRDVLIEASEEFNVPEVKLFQAIQDPPSIFERFTFGKERFIAYIRAALLEHFRRDNVVYHGLAGHFLVRDVSHVLKVRILAELEDRIKVVMQRDGIAGREEALRTLKSIDEARRKWSLHVCGIDTNDPSLYDLVIHIKKLSTDDAVEVIAHAVGLERFQTTTQSQQAVDDLSLAARVKASLIASHPRADVAAEQGVVFITMEGAGPGEEQAAEDAAAKVPGVGRIQVKRHPVLTPD